MRGAPGCSAPGSFMSTTAARRPSRRVGQVAARLDAARVADALDADAVLVGPDERRLLGASAAGRACARAAFWPPPHGGLPVGAAGRRRRRSKTCRRRGDVPGGVHGGHADGRPSTTVPSSSCRRVSGPDQPPAEPQLDAGVARAACCRWWPPPGPISASNGLGAASISVVRMPRAVAADATSWPIRPAPTIARCSRAWRAPSSRRDRVVERAQDVDARAAKAGERRLGLAPVAISAGRSWSVGRGW